MSRKLQFAKALRLLDANRNEEAVTLLNTILEESKQENDLVHMIRSCCVLGEYYFNTGNLQEAKKYLEIAANTAMDDDQAAILDYEINHARELLTSLR